MASNLKSIRIKNFKAIRDSGVVKLTPLTVFIGNNGSGKSSLIEALRTLQYIVDDGLDQAMQTWAGFEHIWHKGVDHKVISTKDNAERPSQSNPMSFEIKGRGHAGFKSFSAVSEISLDPSGDGLFFVNESVTLPGQQYIRDRNGQTKVISKDAGDSDTQKIYPIYVREYGGTAVISIPDVLSDDNSLLSDSLEWFISDWQYLSLNPDAMGAQVARQRTGSRVVLASDGSNIAEYLLNIRQLDQGAFDGIVETLQYVLPYALDLQPAITSELERNVYLQLTEGDYKVFGWLLSSGTLRLVALLALLRHPTPPPLIMIEEIENGIDPRALHLLVDEIRRVTESRTSQILMTTHSPYLLDLLDLSHIVIVEKDGDTKFSRPSDKETLEGWRKNFTVGQLYTMGKLSTSKQ